MFEGFLEHKFSRNYPVPLYFLCQTHQGCQEDDNAKERKKLNFSTKLLIIYILVQKL